MVVKPSAIITLVDRNSSPLEPINTFENHFILPKVIYVWCNVVFGLHNHLQVLKSTNPMSQTQSRQELTKVAPDMLLLTLLPPYQIKICPPWLVQIYQAFTHQSPPKETINTCLLCMTLTMISLMLSPLKTKSLLSSYGASVNATKTSKNAALVPASFDLTMKSPKSSLSILNLNN